MNATAHPRDLDWQSLTDALDADGYATTPPVISTQEREALTELYDDNPDAFRTTVDMQRYNFGRGEYKYLSYPLPGIVQRLRSNFYPPLAKIANAWSARVGDPDDVWPATLPALTARCRDADQHRPTPLLLRYRDGDYNCLHQDLYGQICFPLQVVIMLSIPGVDFDGGELILVEQRPRMMSRPMVVPLETGCAAVFPARYRPRQGRARLHRVQMRHGVSRVRRGTRNTLGIIFHDAA